MRKGKGKNSWFVFATGAVVAKVAIFIPCHGSVILRHIILHSKK